MASLPAILFLGALLLTPAVRPAPKTRSSSFQLPPARPLASDYVGPESVRQQLDGGLARPTALATDDFDEDGVPDLVSGYTGPNGGLLTVHRGNVDAIYPHSPEAKLRKAAGAFTDAPFLTPGRIFEVPAVPDFLGAGDFDNDGHRDIVAAARGGSSLYLFPGDGHGGLGAARSVALGGQVTAMIAGEIDRKDGLADLVVGIDTEGGSAVLVFEGPEGALDSIPEVIALPAAPMALTLGRLDDDVFFDLAVAAGQELMILRGRNSKLPRPDRSRSGIGTAVLEEIVELDSPIASIAVGHYAWDGRRRQQLALLSADGTLHLLARGATSADPWRQIGERHVLAQPADGPVLVTARVSGLPLEELVILDRGASRLLLTLGEVRADPHAAGPEGALGQPLSGSLDGAPVAALPMRLNRDALSDLVLLQEGMLTPTIAVSAQSHMIFVNAPTDSGPVPGDGLCQLSEAIANANTNSDTTGGDCTAGSGADTIEFIVTFIEVSLPGLPELTDPGDTIDGTTACGTDTPPCVELRGNTIPVSGLEISASAVTVRGLVIDDFDPPFEAGGGIKLSNSSGSIVEGNSLSNIGGFFAIFLLNSASNKIGGTMDSSSRNVMTESFGGLLIAADAPGLGSLNKVQGNYIGTDGTNPLPNNFFGISMSDAELQEIGGADAYAGNLISANGTPNPVITELGILIHEYQDVEGNSNGCMVQGNYIGTNDIGTEPMSNGTGVAIWGSDFCMVGGTAPGARNVISGNDVVGIQIRKFFNDGVEVPIGNCVQGNYIGTKANGEEALGNGLGVDVRGDDNLVGGTATGAGNVISGNDQGNGGVHCADGTGNRVQGNLIGTDASGSVPLPNVPNGVNIESTCIGCTVGGTAEGAGNVISGNIPIGVTFSGTNSNLEGNFIGTDASGSVALPNAGPGVIININTGNNNTIGGTAFGAGNLIAHNGGPGVVIVAGVSHSVLGNSIIDNVGMGIDLGNDGATPNDEGDPDSGVNNLQNFPVLSLAEATPSSATVDGSLNSTPNSLFRVEFFASPACDSSGHGEGSRYLGFTEMTTDGTGDVSFSAALTGPVSDGEAIAATATTTGPSTSSSEFSECLLAICLSTAVFSQTVVAQDKNTLSWGTPDHARFVKGDLPAVSSYLITGTGELPAATWLDISSDNPGSGDGLYYLIRSLACGSWQTTPGAEPDRDAELQ